MGSKKKKSSIKKRILSKLLRHPGILFLFMAGVTDLATLWAFGINSGIGFFAGVACILGAIGWFLSRLLLGSDNLAREVLAEMKEEAQEDHNDKLDQLEKRLEEDGDPRTEKLLRGLREITEIFHESQSNSSPLNSSSTFDILTGVEQLFSRSVLSLEKTLQLWQTAQRISAAEARDPILEKRERIIEDVDKSIRQLGKILAGIQCLGTGADSEESDLARIREELNQSLEVAKNVEKRMKTLDRDLKRKQRTGG
ncbi:MAG: hypothetical protein JRJ87_03690 [Deltaproteobacteria bacterium]|nr:hypothetical protein [Deltaproteobacteria bacterium]